MRGTKVSIVAGLALVVGLAFLLIHSDDRPDVNSGKGETPRGVPQVAGGDDAGRAVETSRFEEPTAESPKAPSADGPRVRVRVLEGAARNPVAGAEVSVVDARRYFARIRAQGLAHGSPKSRSLLKAMERTAVSGPDGSASVSREGFSDFLTVEARLGESWGFAVCNKGSAEPVDVIMHVDRVLRIRVTTPGGDPIAGVPIALRQKTSARPVTYQQKLTETEAPDGIGYFEHVQRRFEMSGAGWHATFGFPLLELPTILVSNGPQPKEPVDLVLPGAGSVEVRVRDENGKPVSNADSLGLSVEAFPDAARAQAIWTADPWSRPQLHADGVARLPWMGLGLHLRVTAKATSAESERKPVVVDCFGPVTDGENIICTVTVPAEAPPSERYPTIVGRFVLADGTPRAPESVSMWPYVFPTNYSVPTRTVDVEILEGGRFELLVRAPWPEGGTRRYRVLTKNDHVSTWIDLSRHLPPGTTEIGDVILDHGALVVAGTVVDDAGYPVEKARITVYKHAIVNGKEFWPTLQTSGTWRTGPDGMFALHVFAAETPPTADLKVNAYRDGYLHGGMIPVTMGTRDLRCVLERGGGIAGSVALGPGQDPTDVRIALKSGRHRRYLELDGEGMFARQGLEPGAWTVTVSLRARGSLKTIVDGVEVASGRTTRDSRLQGLRIEGTVTKVILTIVETTGAPIERAKVDVIGRGDLSQPLSDRKGRVAIRVETLPVDLLVSAYGYRRVRLTDVRDDREVTLKKGLRIRLTTSATTHGSNPKWHVGALVMRQDMATGAIEFPFQRIQPFGGHYFNEKGHLDITLSEPGKWVFQPHLVILGDVGTGGGLGIAPSRVDVKDIPGLQTFNLDIPQSAIDKAVEKFKK